MKTFIIAEIAQAHDGSLGILHSYIDALKNTGVDAIKFQTHIAEAESSEYEPFRIKFSYEDATRFDYWKRMEFTPEQWKGVKKHCDEVNIEFISSPFSNAAIDLLENLGVNRYKIGSGEVANFLMLEKIAGIGKPVILSSGMSSFEELDRSINFLKLRVKDLSLLQCTTAYPTMPNEWGLNILKELKERYELPVGFSDHSGDIYAGLAATALGAELIEFHVVFDKLMFGPDSQSSLTINEVTSLTKGIRQINFAQNNPINKNDIEKYTNLKSIFEKSLSVNKDLFAGHIIEAGDLEAKKPKGYGIPASEYQDIVGRKITRNLKKWDFLNLPDVNS